MFFRSLLLLVNFAALCSNCILAYARFVRNAVFFFQLRSLVIHVPKSFTSLTTSMFTLSSTILLVNLKLLVKLNIIDIVFFLFNIIVFDLVHLLIRLKFFCDSNLSFSIILLCTGISEGTCALKSYVVISVTRRLTISNAVGSSIILNWLLTWTMSALSLLWARYSMFPRRLPCGPPPFRYRCLE